jgi:hypothetical protein
MEAMAHGKKSKAGKFGPSPEVAAEMLKKTSHKSKSNFAKSK